MKKVIIFGSGTIAEVANYYFEIDSDEHVEAFCVDDEFYHEKEFLNKPVVKYSNLTNHYPPNRYKIFIALSYRSVNRVRTAKYEALKNLGYEFASYISTKATILNGGKIGDNAFILENNTIQPFVIIGSNVTLWSGNHIGHHSHIHNHNFISSHVVISGGVTIEEGSFFGVNATLRDHITIGSNCVIGAGALVMRDIPTDSIITAEKSKISDLAASKLTGF
jgi:sugar O-acyltransferase (sialic acid O-acetyltransferase NeuD family)